MVVFLRQHETENIQFLRLCKNYLNKNKKLSWCW